MKRLIYFAFFLLYHGIGHAQIVSNRTRSFVQDYLWKFQISNNPLDVTFEKFCHYVFIRPLEKKKIRNIEMSIYIFGIRSDHTLNRILIERKKDNLVSQFAVIGEGPAVDDPKVMYAFFEKFNFSDVTKVKCYEELLRNVIMTHAYISMFRIDVDSLFKYQPK